jgi:Tfp pilus assembly protein PilE
LTLQSLRRDRQDVARQRGLSIVGLVVLIVLIGILFVIGARVLPTFIEYRAIQSAVKKASSQSSVVEIQKAFDRSAAIDDITSVNAKELEIKKVNDETVISFAYTKKIPLFGPVSLSIDYAGNSKSL